jgi:hypothetical protein
MKTAQVTIFQNKSSHPNFRDAVLSVNLFHLSLRNLKRKPYIAVQNTVQKDLLRSHPNSSK